MSTILSYQRDKQNVCFFCYKTGIGTGNGEVLRNFKRLAGRYIGDEFVAAWKAEENEVSAAAGVNDCFSCCNSCGILLRSFCEIYDNLKYLELRLEWRLRGLLDIMRSANRVNSRVGHLKRLFLENTKRSENELQTETGSSRLKRFKSFRADVMLTCSQRLSTSLPKIVLTRINGNGRHSSSVKNSIKHDCKPESSDSPAPRMEDLFINWAISLVAVGMLLITPPHNFQSIFQPNPQTNVIDGIIFDLESHLVDTPENILHSECSTSDTNLENTRNVNSVQPFNSTRRKQKYSQVLAQRNKRNLRNLSAKIYTCRLCKHQFLTNHKLQIHKLTSLRHKSLRNIYKITKRKAIFKNKTRRTNFFKSTVLRECKLEMESANENEQVNLETKQEVFEKASPKEETLNFSPSQRYSLRKKVKRSYKRITEESDHNDSASSEEDTDLSSSSSSSEHDAINHRKSSPELLKCGVCELMVPKYFITKHFQRWHETNGQEIDSSNARKCTTPECTAFFLKGNNITGANKQFSLHMKNVHDTSLKKVTVKSENISKKANNVKINPRITKVKVEQSESEESETENVSMHECLKCQALGISRSFQVISNYQDHQKFHKEGKFQCHFCENIEKDIVALGIHELNDHSNDDVSDSTQKVVFSCPRCKTVHCSMWMYIEHFADTHLPDFESTSRTAQVECDVCHFEIKKYQLDNHFSSFHDKRNLSNGILECSHPGCLAYFVWKSSKDWAKHQLKYHTRHVHENIDDFQNFNFFDHSTVDGQEDFKCKLCGNSFASKLGVYRHTIRCRKRKKSSQKISYESCAFRCSVPSCKASYGSEKDLQKHKTQHGKFSCKFCNVIKGYAPDLAIHESDEHSEKVEESKIRCSRCPSQFYIKPPFIEHFLETHLNLETPSSGYCKICGSETISVMKDVFLKRHFKKCHNKKGLDPNDIHRCDQCPAYFIKALQLYLHKMNFHFKRKCPGCGKSYEKLDHLKYHIEKCQPESLPLAFACDTEHCTRKFSSAAKLNQHKKTCRKNEPAKIYKCTKCSKQYTKEVVLRAHLHQVHGPKKHLCSECGKAFGTKEGLNRHLQLHEGMDRDAWEYQCTMCGKKFPLLQRLEVHMRMHTNEKPFVCQFCGNSYAHSLGLTRHVKASHKGKPSGLNDITN